MHHEVEKVCIVRSVVSKLLFEMRLDETEIRDGKKREMVYWMICTEKDVDRQR